METKDRWLAVDRWQEYEGEAHANLLRLFCIAIFYAIELVNFYGLRIGSFRLPKVVDHDFHLTVTVVTATWLAVATTVHLCLRRQILPGYLKFLSTGADLLLLTLTLLLADGQRSPLVVLYFLGIVLSGLRFSLPLVRFATVGSLAGYLAVLGYDLWFRKMERLPHYHLVIVFAALAMTGILCGQIIRRVRELAEDFARGDESRV